MIACKKCNELTPRLIVYLFVFKIKGSKRQWNVSFWALWDIFIFYLISMRFLSKKLLYVCQQIFAISDHFEKIGVKGVKNAVSKGKNALFIFLKFPIVFWRGLLQTNPCEKSNNSYQRTLLYILPFLRYTRPKRAAKEILIFHQISVGLLLLWSSQRKIW